MDVLDKICRLKEERGWTDYRLAKESGLRQSTISSLYKKNYNPTLSTLESICRAFGITLSQFFSDEQVPLDLTEHQRDVLVAWNHLSEKKKTALLRFIKEIS